MTIKLSEYATKLASNSNVLLQKVEPSNQTMLDWLEGCETNFQEAGGEKIDFFNAVYLVNKINCAVTNKSYLSLEDRGEVFLCCSVGEKSNQKTTSRRSGLTVGNGRVFIKAKNDLKIRFTIDKKYIANFDEKMDVTAVSKGSIVFGNSYKGRFKKERHEDKPDLRVREVHFELNALLFDKLEDYFSIFKSTEYYEKCSILQEWMPSVLSQKEIQDEIKDIQKSLNTIQDNASLTETEKETLIKIRVGQGIFRSRLEIIEPQCRITLVSNKRHLIASHIKPWSQSDNSEKLDGNNGLLLAPHIDHLFDKGYVSFEDNGDLIISEHTSKDLLNSWSVESGNYGSFNVKQKFYMDYHRNEVFEKFLKSK